MPTSVLDTDVSDAAPTRLVLTAYDERHASTYLRLLEANADNIDWRAVARTILHIDPAKQPARARTAYETHLARAKWMSSHAHQALRRKRD
jgi:hypothetical protein